MAVESSGFSNKYTNNRDNYKIDPSIAYIHLLLQYQLHAFNEQFCEQINTAFIKIHENE